MIPEKQFFHIYGQLLTKLHHETSYVNTGTWQAKQVTDPSMDAKELLNVVFSYSLPISAQILAEETSPNIQWAEDHFKERVSGIPFNPPPSETRWPFAVNNNSDSKEVGKVKFSHTYPERFWPKWANQKEGKPHRGVRYELGDLSDLVNMLIKNPHSRQAYLPVWFPEDTGAIENQRVPCTLGYQFLIRRGRVDATYFIRSCDILRHFPDDVYLAGRLVQWVTQEVNNGQFHHTQSPNALIPGTLTMHIVNLHYFRGDEYQVHQLVSKFNQENNQRLMERL